MLRFEIGDEVVIIDNTNSHGFRIGDTVEIAEKFHRASEPSYYRAKKGKEQWFIRDTDVRPAVKYPLGVTPRRLLKEQRLGDLKRAITDYIKAGLSVDPEWIAEYNELIKKG